MRHRILRPPLTILVVALLTSTILLEIVAQGDPLRETPTVRVIAEGLRNPVGLALAADGSLFIAEEGTGERDLSAGVSLMLPDGTIGRYISDLPSGRDSGDLSGVALVQVAPEGDMLYVGNFGAGHLWTLTLPDGALALPEAPYTPDDLSTAMQPFNRVLLTNPFDMTFDAAGVPVVADASQNGVATETADGRTRFIHRFPELIDPTNESLTIDPVPTGIDRIGDEYFVTLTGGCPYPTGGGELVAIDENRNQRTVIDDLNMPIDVAQGPDGRIWLLEFARFAPDGSCFSGSGYLADTGRLSLVLGDGLRQTVVDNLNFPGAVLPLPDGSLYITEVFDGEILHVTFGEPEEAETAESFTTGQRVAALPALDQAPQYADIDDADAALRAMIEAHDLQPYPGQDIREGETALAELGRDLFFDPILSGDQNISCATCHHPAFGMADGRVLPIGTGGHGLGPERDFLTHITLRAEYSDREYHDAIGQQVINPAIGQFVPRNSPTIINSALLPVQFWDGRVQSYALGGVVETLEQNVNAVQLSDILAAQALFPIISRSEMAGATFGEEAPQRIRRTLMNRLMAIPNYAERFQAIFGTDEIEPVQLVQAIAAFERQMIFTESPWDHYIAGDLNALTQQQKRGALLFHGELNPAVNCATCHSGDLFTDLDFHNLLVPQLGPGKGNGINGREDWGRANVTFDWRDRYQFRTPSLRNVTLTAPYFHTGAYATLDGAIRHHANIWAGAENYDPSAHLPQQFFSSLRPFDAASMGVTASPELSAGLPLTDDDIGDIVAYLQSLTDPAAADMMHIIPESVPSGLSLDPLPQATPAPVVREMAPTVAVTADVAEDAPAGEWRFVNVADEAGLNFTHAAFLQGLYEEDPAAAMGAGLCWIDYDNDGWLDLYLVNSWALEEYEHILANGIAHHSALYRNLGGTFAEVSAETGTDLRVRGNGCVAADLNMDGHKDLYVTVDGPNVLLWNNGDGTFTRDEGAAGIDAPEWSSVASVGDLNGDGWPDLFVGAYIDLDNKIPNPMGAFPQDYFGLLDRLYLNNGPDAGGQITFRDVTLDVGLERTERTLGAVFSDVDLDGDLDLYVANDGQPNRLHENVPLADDPLSIGFRFMDLTDTAEVGDSGSGMGVASADYDGDGFFDLFVTNWEAELNALYRNETAEEGFINFRYSTYRIGMRGLGNNMTGWGATWADFDHDTDVDLVNVNGRVPVTNLATDPELVRLYGNRLVERGRPEYLPWTDRVGLDAIGPLLARGSAVADYDNDGDLDIAINVIAGQPALLRNDGVAGNSLQIAFSRFVPGTVVTVALPDGRRLLREWHAGSSYLASEDPRLHFGLGDAATVAVEVRYPDGRVMRQENVAANQIWQAP